MAPSAAQQATAAMLKAVARPKFDTDYDSGQIAGHKISIAETDTEIAKGTAMPVIAYAKWYLPVAKMHLSMAEKAHKALPVSAK
jgi:hypothetical protein